MLGVKLYERLKYKSQYNFINKINKRKKSLLTKLNNIYNTPRSKSTNENDLIYKTATKFNCNLHKVQNM